VYAGGGLSSSICQKMTWRQLVNSAVEEAGNTNSTVTASRGTQVAFKISKPRKVELRHVVGSGPP
jgi:hypothetical protein